MTRAARPFAALFWKEMLELTRYSAPASVLYAVFIWMDTIPAPNLLQVVEPAQRLMWFGLFNSFVGVVLGFYQVWRETRIDTWAFAVHRPVSRNRVFAAKVVAGQLTLLIVAGLPYTAAMIWTAMPGHVAVPFDWHMWQPGIADLLAGFVFHAAGLFVGARHRGVLARPLALVAAILAGFLIRGSQPFWGAVASAVIVGSVLLVAAWATFISRDDPERQPWLGRVANVVVLVPACLALYAIGEILGGTLIPQTGLEFERAYKPVSQALVTPDGEIARVTLREPAIRPGDDDELFIASARDLEGRPRPDLVAKLGVSPAGAGVLVTDQMMLRGPSFDRGYRSASRWVQRLFASERRPVWYFERRHRVISVYDDSTHQRLGWIGPDGFLAGDTMPTHRYEGDLISNYWSEGSHLLFTGAVYTADYPKPPKLFFRAPPGDTILDFARPSFRSINSSGYASGPSWSQFYAVATSRGVIVLDTAGRVELVSPHPTPMRRRTVNVWRAPNAAGRPTFVWYPAQTDSLNRVFEYRQGVADPVTRQFTGPMLQPGQRGYGGTQVISYVSGTATGFGMMPFWTGPSIEFSVGSVDAEPVAPSRRSVMTALLLNAASMLVVWLIGRRYAFSRHKLGAWLLAALIGGPFALFVMWLTVDFPARERCPSCGKMRVVDRERCEHCGAPFPAPAPDGTEIFAMST